MIKEYGNLPPIECYAGQLNQVFMNIIVNAIDALEDRCSVSGVGCGEELPKPYIRIRTEVINGSHIEIRIADNGLGIPKSVHSRIFDPFFTTKPVGKGTSLGLSISHRVVTKHQGQLKCISAPGQGTDAIEIPLPQRK